MQKATTAKKTTTNSQITEKIQLAYHAALTGGQGSYTKDTLMDELKKEFETDYDVDDSDNKNWKMKAQGQEVIIPAGKKDNSKVTIKTLNTNTNLKVVPDLSTYYGETTDYTSVDNVQWQLFYDDDGYIYLIASDYVPGSMLPNELLTEGQSTEYCRYFGNYESYNSPYTGTIMETGEWKNGTDSWNVSISGLDADLDNMWIKTSNDKAIAYWLASPSAANYNAVVSAAYVEQY